MLAREIQVALPMKAPARHGPMPSPWQGQILRPLRLVLAVAMDGCLLACFAFSYTHRRSQAVMVELFGCLVIHHVCPLQQPAGGRLSPMGYITAEFSTCRGYILSLIKNTSLIGSIFLNNINQGLARSISGVHATIVALPLNNKGI
jgi:hypothetical protein